MVTQLQARMDSQATTPTTRQPSVGTATSTPTAQVQTPPTAIAKAVTQALTASQRPRKILPELVEFKGERKELEAWIDQANQKLRIDYASYPETTQAALLFNQLRGTALTYLQP